MNESQFSFTNGVVSISDTAVMELNLAEQDQHASVYWGKTRINEYRLGRSYFPGMSPGVAFSVVGSWLRNGMAVWFGAAQSVILGCSGLRLSSGPRYLASRGNVARASVTYGLTALAMLLCLLAGCAAPTPATADAGDAMLTHDATVNDLGSPDDTAPIPDDVPPEMDLGPSHDMPDAPPADRPVMGYDVQIIHVPGTPTFESYGPPRQARRSCPAQTEGDPSIAPPRLIFPMSPMRVTSQRPTLFWELPSGVTGASIELCRDPCCTRPITTLQATGSSVRPPTNLSPGVVFWRARGMVEGRTGREVSFTWEFVVRHRDTPTDTAWGNLKDFNGDGFDDLVIAGRPGGPNSTMRVLFGGEGGLSPNRTQTLSLTGELHQIVAGEINGDGHADVLVMLVERAAGRVAEVLSVYLGSPSGLVLSPVRHSVSSYLAVADLNGDGFGCSSASIRSGGPARRAT